MYIHLLYNWYIKRRAFSMLQIEMYKDMSHGARGTRRRDGTRKRRIKIKVKKKIENDLEKRRRISKDFREKFIHATYLFII